MKNNGDTPGLPEGIPAGKRKGTGDLTYQEWLGSPPVFDKIDVELESDVVVCGGGLSGVSAIRAATEEGASVIMFEKTEKLQCRYGDMGSIGSEVSKNWGMQGNEYKLDIMKHFLRESAFWPRPRIIKYWLENGGAALDWYVEAKPDLHILKHTTDPIPEGVEAWLQPARYPGPSDDYVPGDEYFPAYQITVQFRPDQYPVLEANFNRAVDTGLVQSFFKSPVQKLLTDKGKVTGVIAKSFDGTIYKATARKGVVLATGDYSNNLDMLYHYCPWTRNNPTLYTSIDPEGYYADTGDGHRMGMWIGAQMERGPHAPIAHNIGGPLGVAPYLQIDALGERFMNEDVSGQQIENQIATLPDNLSWQIFDSAWPEQLSSMPPSHCCVCYALDDDDVAARRVNHTLSVTDGYTTPGRVEDAVSGKSPGPETIKADTIEELVEKMGVPMETGIATIARYNELARKGVDEDFGKSSKRMFPLEKGPYYATKLKPDFMLVVMSGLESDDHSRCLNGNGYPIPGLYVCGNVQGGRFSVNYPITVPGMSHSMALTYGRRAGTSAAKGL